MADAHRPRYSKEPSDASAFSASFDRRYSRFATAYDLAIKALPIWRNWLRQAIPHIEGPRVLEVSFGTGWLLTQYADRLVAHGVDLNERLTVVARRNLVRARAHANLVRADAGSLPYHAASFDTVVNTMAFTGYPDGAQAMSELARVLRPGGRVVMVDINFPRDHNLVGSCLVEVWKRTGDVVRDMAALFAAWDLAVEDREIAGRGSVHLYLATKRPTADTSSRSTSLDA